MAQKDNLDSPESFSSILKTKPANLYISKI